MRQRLPWHRNSLRVENQHVAVEWGIDVLSTAGQQPLHVLAEVALASMATIHAPALISDILARERVWKGQSLPRALLLGPHLEGHAAARKIGKHKTSGGEVHLRVRRGSSEGQMTKRAP